MVQDLLNLGLETHVNHPVSLVHHNVSTPVKQELFTTRKHSKEKKKKRVFCK
jgi:hypothetical protein